MDAMKANPPAKNMRDQALDNMSRKDLQALKDYQAQPISPLLLALVACSVYATFRGSPGTILMVFPLRHSVYGLAALTIAVSTLLMGVMVHKTLTIETSFENIRDAKTPSNFTKTILFAIAVPATAAASMGLYGLHTGHPAWIRLFGSVFPFGALLFIVHIVVQLNPRRGGGNPNFTYKDVIKRCLYFVVSCHMYAAISTLADEL